MGKYLILALLLNGCAYVHFNAEVDGVGTINKRIIAIGNTELQQVAQKVQGRLEKGEVVIEFGSDSNAQVQTKEDALAFLGKVATLL